MLAIVCGNLSQNWASEWNTTSPDIPKCFQFFHAPIIILVYLVLCTPYLIYLLKKRVQRRPLLKLTLVKLILIIVLIILQLVEIMLNITKSDYGPMAFTVSNICFIICLSLAGVMVLLERRCNAINSGFYFNYWLIHFTICIVRARTAGLEIQSKVSTKDYSRECFIFINFSLVTLSLILSFFSEKMSNEHIHCPLVKNSEKTKLLSHHKEKKREEKERGKIDKSENILECPEYYSSFLSRILFSWITPMIVKGYQQPLEAEDLWRLNEEDYCRNIVPILMKHLQKHLHLDEKVSQENSIYNFEIKMSFDEHSEKEKLINVNDKDKNNVQSKPGPADKEETFDPCLFYALLKSHWMDLLVSGIYKLIQDILTYSNPIFLKLLLQFVSNPEGLFWKGYLIAMMMFVTAMIRTFLLNQYNALVYKIDMRVRSSLISAVYRKSLVLNTSNKDSTVGEIVNLMSIDAQKFNELLIYIHMIWSGPFHIIVTLVFLWFELGPSVLAGLLIMLLMIPINAFIGNKSKNFQTKQLKMCDYRMKVINEILNGIKVLKLYAWELSFMNDVNQIRNKELKYMKYTAYLNAASIFTFTCSPLLVSLTTFGVFVLVSDDNILNPEKAFVSLSLFNILKFPLVVFPIVISSFIQSSVSLKRLTRFLKRREIDPQSVSHDDTPGISALIQNGYFSWDSTSVSPTLQNINAMFPEKQLIAIVGPVGAGKSSILSALLGEIDKIKGKVNMKGSVAYVPQQAWIVNASIRDNILFGLPYDDWRYKRVLKACCLERDLSILKDSDLTEIGERGINLSGGQRQRISLARACYSDSDVFLMDDPLSAVDSHVGKDIIDNVLCSTGILSRRTRILSTHNITVLPKCDRIIVLDNGVISEEGTYADLINHAGPFANFIATYLADDLTSENKYDISAHELEEKDLIALDLQRTYSQSDQIDSALVTSLTRDKGKINESIENLKNDLEQINVDEKTVEKMKITETEKDSHKLIEDEVSKEGNVKLTVYMAYLRSIGFCLAGVALFLFVMTQAFNLLSNLWLVRWSGQSHVASNYTRMLNNLVKFPNSSQGEIAKLKSLINYERDLNLGVYGGLGFVQALFYLLSAVVFAFATIKSARDIHKHLLHSVMHWPMTTFDTLPIGRIMNRFSSDLYSIGRILPDFINQFLLTVLECITVLIIVTLPNPWIIIPLSITIVFYVLTQRFYVTTSRQLKRLDSASKSPIFSHFSETLQGVSSIRAYSLCDKFIKSSDDKVERNAFAYYANIASLRWLAIVLETIGNIIVLMATLFPVVNLHRGLGINAGMVGLSISYALNTTQILNWLVRMSSEVEANIVSIERIEEYSQMTQEAPWNIDEKKPDDSWPNGTIEFVNYSTRYRESQDLVLKNINFTINPREKVGIVGRTGSGKSSLVLALFRMLERTEGEIIINGVPIHELGLHDVRGRLTVIPQDPVLFSGTLRQNLDPFFKHSDEEIWKVLEMSNLHQFVINSCNEKLEMKISEGGENLSVGQRQLVCLARALLRHTNILVLDEATAAVDLDTDALLQKTIRNEFQNCTILTIAHRLNTVIDYDRIIVLDEGNIVEIDSPDNLLKNPDSQFYSMAKSANLL